MTNVERRLQEGRANLIAQGRLAVEDIDAIVAKVSGDQYLPDASKVFVLKHLLKVQQVWPRRCEATGEGMDCGFLLYDSETYKNESDVVEVLREVYEDTESGADELLERAYEEGISVYTEWSFADELDCDNVYVELSTGDVVEWYEFIRHIHGY
jgi:hypothetical protein